MGQKKLHSLLFLWLSLWAELPQPGLSQPGDPSQGHVHTPASPLQPPQDRAGPRVALSRVDV